MGLHNTSFRLPKTFVVFLVKKKEVKKKGIRCVFGKEKGSKKKKGIRGVFGKEKEMLKYSMAPCCNPIPGDNVFGFISVKDGIKVHSKNCPNSIALRSNYAYRIISATWIDSESNEFNAKIEITGIDDIGLVNEITSLISNSMNVNMNRISFETNDGTFSGVVSVEVKNKVILNKLLKRLTAIKGIEKVSRK